MEKFLQYTILGLVTGGVYGIAASGLVVTYTTSGIFNFAHGAMAMLGAFAYWQLRFDWGWPAPLAILVVLLIAAPLLGAGLHRVIMRGLRGTPEVVKIVVPVSVMLGFLALSKWVWNPNQGRVFSKFFGSQNTVTLAGIRITYHEILALTLAVIIAASLRYVFKRTRSGVAMRAVVDDPALLELNGGRPERLATLSWALGAFLAALAGVLITPISGGAMSADALTLLVIDAFAAAMFGRLRSLPATFVGAIVLGLANNYVIAYFPSDKWTWTSNFRQSIPMILLFVILLVLPQDRLRGATVLRTRERFKLPTMRTAVIAGIVLVVVMFLLREIMHPTAINTVAFGMTLSIVALSLVLLTGYAGEINLASLSFGAIGTIVVFHYGVRGVGPDARTTVWSYLLAMVICAAVGALVALPALRLRGLYLALATMAFGVLVTKMILQDISPRRLPILHTDFTFFPSGNLLVPRPKIGPFDLKSMPTFLMFVTVLFAVLGVALIAFRHSNYGRRLAAMKDSPAASATLGMNVVRLKLLVFMLSAAIAGLGGALMSAQLGSVNLDRFIIFLSLSLLMLCVVGGIGYVSGALFAGILLGCGFLAIENTFDKLAADQENFEGLFHFLADLMLIAPATIGVSMGRNPSGAINDMVRDNRALFSSPPHLAVMVVGELGIWALAWQEVISNWWWVILATVFLMVMARTAMAAELKRTAAELPESEPELPPELIGIDRPFAPDDREMLDRALGLHQSGGNGGSAVTAETVP